MLRERPLATVIPNGSARRPPAVKLPRTASPKLSPSGSTRAPEERGLGRDQVADDARRKGMPLHEAERGLAPNLADEAEDGEASQWPAAGQRGIDMLF